MSLPNNLLSIDAVTQYLGGTQAAWDSIATPVPAGIAIFATDTTAVKVGDGTSTYAALPTLFTLSTIINLVSTVNTLAPLASPTFTGIPHAPTASSGTNTTQLATTAFVMGTRLDQLGAPNTAVAWGGQSITSLANPVNAQDAATKHYVDAAISGITIVASTFTNLTVSGVASITGSAAVTGTLMLSGGVSFGSVIDSGNYDFSKHIALYGTSYGMSVTPGRLNYGANSGGAHVFGIGASDIVTITNTGIAAPLGAFTTVTGNVSAATVTASTGTTARTLASRHGDRTNVLDLGADPTGVADFSTALQTAVSALPSTGGAIWFPAGAYKFNSQVLVNSHTLLEFDAGVTFTGTYYPDTISDGSVFLGQQSTKSFTSVSTLDTNAFTMFVSMVNGGSTGSTSYEKAAIYANIISYDVSTYTYGSYYDTATTFKDAVGIQASGFIGSGNSAGRAWGITAEAGSISGSDGTLVGIEIDVVNNGTSQSQENRWNTKLGLSVVGMGPNVSTVGGVVTKVAGAGGFYDGFVVHKDSVSRYAFAVRDLSTYPASIPFSVDNSGNAVFTTITSPAICGVVNVTGLPTDGVTDSSSIIQAALTAAITLAAGGYPVYLRIPPGTYACNTGILKSVSSSWTPSTNVVVRVEGSGRGVTILKAGASMTSLWHEDGNYKQFGGLSNLTLDGNNLATNVLFHEAGVNFDYNDLCIKNAAAGGIALRLGTDSTACLGNNFSNIIVIGADPLAFTTPSLLPKYGIWANTTDSHFTNIWVSNAATACVIEPSTAMNNRWSQVHVWGYGNATLTGLYQWMPAYGFQMASTGSHFDKIGCDGATVAGCDITGWSIQITNSNFWWKSGVGSTTGYTYTTTSAASSGATVLNFSTTSPFVTPNYFPVVNGQFISGASIPNGTTVLSHTSTSITLSNPTTAIIPIGVRVTTLVMGINVRSGGNITVTNTQFSNCSSTLAIVDTSGNSANIFQWNSGASYFSGIAKFDSLQSSSNVINVTTSNGQVAAFTAMASAADYISFTATPTAFSSVLIGITGTTTNKNLQLSPNGSGSILLSGPTSVSSTLQVNSTTTLLGAIAFNAPATISVSTYTVTTTDQSLIFNVGSTCMVTLPSAASNLGRVLILKTVENSAVTSVSSNVVPITGGSAGTGILISTSGKWAMLQSDGTNWHTMMSN